MSDEVDLPARMAAAALNAIIDLANGPGSDGTFTFDMVAACDGLTVALATLLESDPRSRTTKDIREATEAVARTLRVQMRAMRSLRDAGTPAWDFTTVVVQ